MRILASFAAAMLAVSLGSAIPAAMATPAPQLAAAQTGEEVADAIKDLYTRYYAALSATVATPDAGMPPEFDWKVIADGYFTPELAARFNKALASSEPVIDWDFLADGQDFGELKVLSATGTETGDEAKVVMKTSNFGKETTTDVMLVRAADGWRIKDFLFWAGTSDELALTSVLKDAGY